MKSPTHHVIGIAAALFGVGLIVWGIVDDDFALVAIGLCMLVIGSSTD